MCIPFGGLSLQEDCHTFLYPSVGMLLDVHLMNSILVMLGKQASNLSTDLPGEYGGSMIEG